MTADLDEWPDLDSNSNDSESDSSMILANDLDSNQELSHLDGLSHFDDARSYAFPDSESIAFSAASLRSANDINEDDLLLRSDYTQRNRI